MSGLMELKKSEEIKQYPSEPTADLTLMGQSGGMGGLIVSPA